MHKKYIFVFSILLLFVFSVSPLAMAEGEAEPQTTTEATEATTINPDYDPDYYQPSDDYGLLNPVGNWLEQKQFELGAFTDEVNGSIQDFGTNFGGQNSILVIFNNLLPQILRFAIYFALVFFVARKVVGR